MKNSYRIMLGRKSVHAQECFNGGFIGADYGINEDLTGKLPDAWKDFNATYIPVYIKTHPDKTRIAAGLACGFLWTIAKGLQKGDIVICPDGTGRYHVGEITGDYYFVPGGNLPHRRLVQWLDLLIDRSDLSDDLQHSTGSTGTVCNISRAGYAEEIERFISGVSAPTISVNDETVENPSAFAMESHLEEFLVRNWSQTDLGKQYDIYEEDGDCVGQQYQTDTGPLDILAVSKDKKVLLVVELKKGRASDVVVGQTLRYMGYVQEELAEEGQTVKGVIIALEDDPRIRRALQMTPIIEFFRYEVSFRLVKI